MHIYLHYKIIFKLIYILGLLESDCNSFITDCKSCIKTKD